MDRWRTLEPDADPAQRDSLAELVQAQAAAVELAVADPAVDRSNAEDGPPSARRCWNWNTR